MLTSLTLGAVRATERGPDRTAEPAAASPTAPADRVRSRSDAADAPLRDAAEAAIARLFAARTVAVTSFHDESTGRMVYRVSDAHSGEVLLQEPAEALLRLYASARADQGPLVALEV